MLFGNRLPWSRNPALLLTLALAVQAVPVEAQQAATPADKIDWQGDLEYLATVLPRVHENAFHSTSRARFETAIRKLSEKLPRLSDSEIRAEFAALVAMIGDGHTRVNLLVPGEAGTPAEPAAGYVSLPIALYWYDDGIHVKSSDPRRAELVGARLVQVGGLPIEEAATRLSRFVHRDNQMTVRMILPWLMTRPAFLHAAGIIGAVTAVPMLFETASGKRLPRVLQSVRGADKTAVDAFGEMDLGARPLWLRGNDRAYWMQLVDSSKTLYLQFNVVRDRGEEDLASFARRVDETIRTSGVERVIVDLRHNDGGDFVQALPLVDVLDRFDEAHGPGSLFITIGRRTFSAAAMVAALLEKRTRAVFVGEPTGARPNTYGDMDTFSLPSSGLSVSYSELYVQPTSPYDQRPWIDPDVTVSFTYADYRAGRDPALEAIDDFQPQAPLAPRLLRAAWSGGVGEALGIYYDYMNQPENRQYWAADDLVQLGFHFWNLDSFQSSLRVWSVLARDYPDFPEGLENMVETYQAIGQRDAAVNALFTSLARHPDNQDSVELVRELCGAGAVRVLMRIDPTDKSALDLLRQRCP